MKSFRERTRRSRLYHFRQLAQSALAAYGLADANLSFIQYGENITYRVDHPSARPGVPGESPYHPNRYLLRILAMDDEQATLSELTWLAALHQEAGLPVPMPVAAPDGQLLLRIATPAIPQGRVVSLMRWLDGRKIQKGLQPHHLKALGQVVARLHNFSATWQPPTGFDRPVWNWDNQLGGSCFDHPRADLIQSMPEPLRQPFEEVSRSVWLVMEALGTGPDAFGLIHADLYPENVLYHNGAACPIDFEDGGYGYFMWDIAVALCTWAWQEGWERMRDAFRQGYSQYRAVPDEQWQYLDLFIATQFATMVLWASEFLQHDPARSAEYIPWRDRNGQKLLEYLDRV